MQLGYYPLLKAGIIDTAHLIADCASGVSGAGKGGHGSSSSVRPATTSRPSNVSGHRHQPETEARAVTGDKVRLIFTRT